MRFPIRPAIRDFATSKRKSRSNSTDISADQYPQQAPDGRRSLRAMETSPTDTNQADTHDSSRSADGGAKTAARTEYPYHSDVSGRPSTDDDEGFVRQDPLPSELDIETPSIEKQDQGSVSPEAFDFEDRFVSNAGPRERRDGSRYSTSRTKYDYGVSREDVRNTDRRHARSRSQASSTTQRQAAHTLRAPTSARTGSAVTSSRYQSRSVSPDVAADHGYGAGDRSSEESVMSQETTATSISTLPALQTKGPDNSDAQLLEPLTEDDPRSWDLVEPASVQPQGMYELEKRSEQMFSSDHLRTIFNDPKLLLKFTGFLNAHRPKSIAILIYYLDALKAIRAIDYANAIAEALEPIRGQDFTKHVAKPTSNKALVDKAEAAFDLLAQEDLPAFIAHTWIQVVSISIQRRINGTLAPHLREASEGLAEVFCLTDPSRADNPIVFASEEFVRTTQYGVNYVIGRNCRFLQGPRTNPNSVRRLAIANTEGKEHTEVFVNYRRDGSPFMNLLMTAPLMDSRGNIRYYIGAQVDVSGLVKECSNLDGLAQMVEKERDPEAAAEEEEANRKDEFQELTEMFNSAELDTVRKSGGRMHREYVDDSDRESISGGGKRRVLLKDSTQEVTERLGGRPTTVPSADREKINGKLAGVYQNYLLIRPAPSLRILFTSPSLRVPGILQSPFLDRIGGSSRVRADLRAALGEGRGVTAKIRWLTRADADGEGEGRPRWIHCTPLFGHSGAVGVWMVVLVDDEGSAPRDGSSGRRFRNAPPVSSNIGGKEWEGSGRSGVSRERDHGVMSRGRDGTQTGASREKENRGNHYDADTERRGAGTSRLDPQRIYADGVGGTGGPSRRNSTAPGSSQSHSSKFGVASGDVSEFSFQLK